LLVNGTILAQTALGSYVEEEIGMIVVSQNFYRTALVAALSVAVFNFGCAKKPISAPPPARSEAPAPRPTITFQANPTSINKGESTTLSWSTTNATQVAIAPEVGPVAAEGSTKVTPTDSATYTLTATGPGGSADASARITIATAAASNEPTDVDRSRVKPIFALMRDLPSAQLPKFSAPIQTLRLLSKVTATSVVPPNTTSASAIAAPLP